MLKYTGLIGGALATLVVVPSATFQDARSGASIRSLEAALGQTVEAIELLAGIESHAREGDPITVSTVREISEQPLPGARERDEKLQILRTQVNLLQQELDLVESRMIAGQADGTSRTPGPRPAKAAGITTGLDAGVLNTLRKLEKPTAAPTPTRAPVEETGYSADTLLQAQACYRAGQFERGVALLQGATTPAGRYWLGRCLERSGRLTEAAAQYRKVADTEGAGSFAERAKTNLEFVEWRIQFVEKLPEGARR